MDDKIRQFIVDVVSTHDKQYPSCDGELEALVDAVRCEFGISEIESRMHVIGTIRDIENGINPD
jgi:ferredoxin-fold anticodon binding domain-containing protein